MKAFLFLIFGVSIKVLLLMLVVDYLLDPDGFASSGPGEGAEISYLAGKG